MVGEFAFDTCKQKSQGIFPQKNIEESVDGTEAQGKTRGLQKDGRPF